MPRTAPLINQVLTEKLGTPAIEVDVVPLHAGLEFDLQFLRDSGEWRRGVLLMTDGLLEINGVRDSQLTLWRDTAPASVHALCVRTKSNVLELFNVWDQGRGRAFRRQYSGMIRNQLDRHTLEYHCLDHSPEPARADFERFVFRLRFAEPITIPPLPTTSPETSEG